jgi:hypothetical protein
MLKEKLATNGRLLTVDTSLNLLENGDTHNLGTLKLSLKNAIKPFYLFLLKNRKVQFWGWQRNNLDLVRLFEKNGFILIKSYPSKNQSFQLFKVKK